MTTLLKTYTKVRVRSSLSEHSDGDNIKDYNHKIMSRDILLTNK